MTRPPSHREPLHLDPDPLTVEPEPVRRLRDDVDELPMQVFWLGFAAALIFLAALAAALLLAAPRGARNDEPTSRAADRSELPGAPQLREPVDGSPSGSGGAPLVAIAGPQWSGTATWFCGHGSPCTAGYGPSDLVAAIDTDLGIPKGARVIVRSQLAGGGSVTVTIRDVCACAGERLIDLTSGAFARLAPLDYGVIPVTIEVVGPGPTLPPTDVTP